MILDSYLVFLLVLPLLTCLALALFGKNWKTCLGISTGTSLFYFGVSIALFYISSQEEAHFVLKGPFLKSLELDYTIGLTSVNKVFLVLSTGILFFINFIGEPVYKSNPKTYFICSHLAVWCLVGAFLSFNFMTFFIFSEVALIPLFLLLYIFGGKERGRTSFQFGLAQASGSLSLLAVIIYLTKISYDSFGVSNIDPRIVTQLNLGELVLFKQHFLIFWGLVISIAFKTGLFPFHFWLKDTHRNQPLGTSLIISGIMIKLGIFMAVQFVIPVFPVAVEAYRDIILGLCGISILLALVKGIGCTNLNELIAYWVAMTTGFVLAGAFIFNYSAVVGGLYHSISHSLILLGLTYFTYLFYRREGTIDIRRYYGMANQFPILSLFVIILFASMLALPFTGGFVGPFMLLIGFFKYNIWLCLLAAFSLLALTFFLYPVAQKLLIGKPEPESEKIPWSNKLVLAVVIILIVLMGIFPAPVVDSFGDYFRFLAV